MRIRTTTLFFLLATVRPAPDGFSASPWFPGAVPSIGSVFGAVVNESGVPVTAVKLGLDVGIAIVEGDIYPDGAYLIDAPPGENYVLEVTPGWPYLPQTIPGIEVRPYDFTPVPVILEFNPAYLDEMARVQVTQVLDENGQATADVRLTRDDSLELQLAGANLDKVWAANVVSEGKVETAFQVTLHAAEGDRARRITLHLRSVPGHVSQDVVDGAFGNYQLRLVHEDYPGTGAPPMVLVPIEALRVRVIPDATSLQGGYRWKDRLRDLRGDPRDSEVPARQRIRRILALDRVRVQRVSSPELTLEAGSGAAVFTVEGEHLDQITAVLVHGQGQHDSTGAGVARILSRTAGRVRIAILVPRGVSGDRRFALRLTDGSEEFPVPLAITVLREGRQRR